MKKQNSRKRKWVWLAVAAVVVAAVVAIVVLATRDKPIPVQIDKVTRGELQQLVSASGTVDPAVKVEISANLAAEIRRLYVKEGESVKKGQLLVGLDNTRYQATTSQSQAASMSAGAQVRLMEAQLQLAEKTLARQQELFTKKLTSKELLDNAETQFNVARANLEAARNNVRQADAGLRIAGDELAKTEIRAPMDGLVTRLAKEEGEIALGSVLTRDVIMVISDPSQMVATVEVDEADIVELQIGNTATIEIDALPEVKFSGRVIEIAGSAKVNSQLSLQEQTVSFEVKILLEGDTARIRPGMSATADIVTATMTDVFQAPIQCVTMRNPEALEKLAKTEDKTEAGLEAAVSGDLKKMKELLFVVRDGAAQPLWVTTGISSDTNIELAGEGLAVDQEIICGPFKILNRELKPGDKVEAKKVEKPAAGEPEK